MVVFFTIYSVETNLPLDKWDLFSNKRKYEHELETEERQIIIGDKYCNIILQSCDNKSSIKNNTFTNFIEAPMLHHNLLNIVALFIKGIEVFIKKKNNILKIFIEKKYLILSTSLKANIFYFKYPSLSRWEKTFCYSPMNWK